MAINWTKLALYSVLIGALVGWHQLDKRNAVNVAKASTEASLIKIYNQKVIDAVVEQRKLSEKAQSEANRIQESKNAKLEANNTELSRKLVSLQQRAKRPETITYSSTTVETCTARELYREDAEFLTREAARAESVLIERDYYYEQYESVRKLLGSK